MTDPVVSKKETTDDRAMYGRPADPKDREIAALKEELWRAKATAEVMRDEIDQLKRDLFTSNDRLDAMARDCMRLHGASIEAEKLRWQADKARMDYTEFYHACVAHGYRGCNDHVDLLEWLADRLWPAETVGQRGEHTPC